MMAFYNLPKQERAELVTEISSNILKDLENEQQNKIISYFGDEDGYIRKSAYLSIGKLYFVHKHLQLKIIRLLDELWLHQNFKIRQTVINGAGEIGKKDFQIVEHFFDRGLFDEHYSPRNAVIGSIKKNG